MAEITQFCGDSDGDYLLPGMEVGINGETFVTDEYGLIFEAGVSDLVITPPDGTMTASDDQGNEVNLCAGLTVSSSPEEIASRYLERVRADITWSTANCPLPKKNL